VLKSVIIELVRSHRINIGWSPYTIIFFNKQNTPIMKQFILPIVFTIMFAFTSCGERHYNPNEDVQTTTVLPVNSSIQVISSVELSFNNTVIHIRIDNCEYILYHGSSGKAITHHENCNNLIHHNTR